MRIIRVRHQGHVFYASLGEGEVISLNRQLGYDAPIPLRDVGLMPLVQPSKIVCIAHNYADRLAEEDIPTPDHPLFFLRPPCGLVANGQPVLVPEPDALLYYEAEMAFVIGQPCRHIRPDEAQRHIFGYTCANNITVRDRAIMPSLGVFDSMGKAHDGTCPLGPWLETTPPDPESTPIRCVVNEEVVQSGLLGDMLFSPAAILSYLSHIMTLNPGDVVLTGSPSGSGILRTGDTVQVEIPSIGVLFNTVTDEQGTTPLPVQ